MRPLGNPRSLNSHYGLGQIKQLTYAADDLLTGRNYSNALNQTPNVSFVYDPYFPRVVSMSDGNGVTQFTYAPPFSIGAMQLQQECMTAAGSSVCNAEVNYSYDELGRLSSRTVEGAGMETYRYDNLGRLVKHVDDLGEFDLSYLGQTAQPTLRQLNNSSLSTAWSYLGSSGDRRLAGIENTGFSQSQFSNFQFTSTAESLTVGIAESSDTSPTYPVPVTQTASFNNLNQLTNLSGQSIGYDANGNILSDGSRTFTWDAENRLVGISYPNQPGKHTSFGYDGMGRRTLIASAPAGGGPPVATNYIWCGFSICQARDANNVSTREYFTEGEFVPGSPTQSYYYGIDQINSPRRVFVSTSVAPAYAYDSYGNPLQSTPQLTDFNYAGMFYNGESGLYLTPTRAYDPVSGRWLSRDPMGEITDPSGNLYSYVYGSPVNFFDRDGYGAFGAAIGGAIGGAAFGAAGAETGPLDIAIGLAGRKLGQAIGSGIEDALNGIFQNAGNPDSPDSTPCPPRPDGIPDNWKVQPSDKNGGTEYINPDNNNDRVRVMPPDPDSPFPEQRVPYVIDQNGGFRDVNGNLITGPNPGKTPEAHIPYVDFKFQR